METNLQKHSIILLLTVAILFSCENVSEEERLIYVKPVPARKTVLLEDFTGQRCVNCPKAVDEISRLTEQYGDDAIVAVGIHSGPLGFHTNNRFVGLSTATGDDYFNHWNFDYQPVGMIDRGSALDYTAWNAGIRDAMQKTAPVSITMETTHSEDSINISGDVLATDGDINARLQLWIVEDSVEAFQLMPDGKRNDEYIHQHVFRASVNGDWGEDFSASEGTYYHFANQALISNEWNINNLYVVAFIYNGQGVLQAKKAKINSLTNN